MAPARATRASKIRPLAAATGAGLCRAGSSSSGAAASGLPVVRCGSCVGSAELRDEQGRAAVQECAVEASGAARRRRHQRIVSRAAGRPSEERGEDDEEHGREAPRGSRRHAVPPSVAQRDSEPLAASAKGSRSRPLPPLALPLSPPPAAAPRLPPAFFSRPADELAPLLLGKVLRREEVQLRIVEVEAYLPNDSACHGRFGRTQRTAPMFGPAGRLYVFLCYGLHHMLNITADAEGTPAACLVRAAELLSGEAEVLRRRKAARVSPALLAGPGKIGGVRQKHGAFRGWQVAQALAVCPQWSHHALSTAGGVELLDAPPVAAVLRGPRVGIEYAAPEDAAAPLRFAVAGSRSVSFPTKTLKGQEEEGARENENGNCALS